eukprot:366480-Chlamydomonas_euryale.AAC.12
MSAQALPQSSLVAETSIAGPGFVNVRVSPAALADRISRSLCSCARLYSCAPHASYNTLAGLILYPCWVHTLPLLGSYSTLAGLILYPCWAHTLPLLGSYSTLAGFILYPCWVHTRTPAGSRASRVCASLHGEPHACARHCMASLTCVRPTAWRASRVCVPAQHAVCRRFVVGTVAWRVASRRRLFITQRRQGDARRPPALDHHWRHGGWVPALVFGGGGDGHKAGGAGTEVAAGMHGRGGGRRGRTYPGVTLCVCKREAFMRRATSWPPHHKMARRATSWPPHHKMARRATR